MAIRLGRVGGDAITHQPVAFAGLLFQPGTVEDFQPGTVEDRDVLSATFNHAGPFKVTSGVCDRCADSAYDADTRAGWRSSTSTRRSASRWKTHTENISPVMEER
jgi:hypothetical protein